MNRAGIIRLLLLAVALCAGTLRADDISFPRTALGSEPIHETANPPVGDDHTAPIASPAMDYTRVLIALGAVIGLIFLLRGCGRLFFPATARRGGGRAVEVLARSPLAPKQQILLLRVGRRIVVVGDCGSRMNTLCEISDPDEVAALVGRLQEGRTPTAAFGGVFGQFARNYGRATEPAAEPPLRDAETESAVESAHAELHGLRERVRLLAEQFRGAEAAGGQ